MTSMDRYAENASEDKNQISKEFVIQIVEKELQHIYWERVLQFQHDSTKKEKKIKKISNVQYPNCALMILEFKFSLIWVDFVTYRIWKRSTSEGDRVKINNIKD